MFDTKAVLAQLDALEVAEAFEAAASLHWQVEHLACRKAIAFDAAHPTPGRRPRRRHGV
jgi:hypothetical protein